MVRVRIFGAFRLDSGIKELQLEASCVKELYPLIVEEARRRNPGREFDINSVKSCIVSINGKQASRRARLCDGDQVLLVSAVAGG